MAQATIVKYFSSGYCEAHMKIVNPKTGKGKARFYAVWALIQIPEMGNILFDTGYNSLFDSETRHWPEWLYRKATPVFLKEEDTAVNLLLNIGIAPQDIDYIIISHFHGDHVCALRDFPKAKFICSEIALRQVKEKNGFAAIKCGIIKKFLPQDFFDRTLTVESFSVKKTDESGLVFHQIFGDQGLKLVEVPGHAAGMLGFLHQREGREILYATDAAWNRDAFFESVLPMKIVKLFFDSWSDFVRTDAQLKSYLQKHPETEIIFTHCPHTLRYIENRV